MNAAKETVGARFISDYLKERNGGVLKSADVLSLAKSLNYSVEKQSIINPYYTTKQTQKQSSKTKAEIV